MNLTLKKCVPCDGGTPTLTNGEIAKLMHQITGWALIEIDGIKRLTKSYKFKDFVGSIDFVNRVKDIAQAEGHHPDLHIHWNQVRVENWTHAIGGLHENDFILAAKIDKVAT